MREKVLTRELQNRKDLQEKLNKNDNNKILSEKGKRYIH